MQKDDKQTIFIELKTVEEFFLEPDYNPFDPESRAQSGIEELVDQVRELPMKEPLKICLTLSAEPEDVDYEEKVQYALSRYCSVKIRECEQDIHELRSQGRHDLVWALTISFVLLLGAYFASQLILLPNLFVYLISTGLGIIAWVVLWPPLDGLLYEWRPCRRSQQIYQRIQSAEMEIKSTLPD
jgi:hypothetical protein